MNTRKHSHVERTCKTKF